MTTAGPDVLNEVVACPRCRRAVTLPDDADRVSCDGCAAQYERLPYAWDLMPPRDVLTDDRWSVWEHLQENGAVSYAEDPEHNLGVGDRPDYRTFGEFCDFTGVTLDVGCGPQRWPAHFDAAVREVSFVGIDPLIGLEPAAYPRVRGIGEHLPFREASFDRVVFATSLDHVVDVDATLAEAGRVCRSDGFVALWIGEKAADAPAPAESPEWYTSLEVPHGAEDRFHLERLAVPDVLRRLEGAGLGVVDHVRTAVSEWRANHFVRAARTT